MKKEKKTCRIQFRLTPTEKKKLDKVIAKTGFTQAKFIRKLILEEKLEDIRIIIQCIELLAEVTDVVRYIQERYRQQIINDPILKRKVEDLWEKLQ